jgi:hypothetical protein
MPRTSGLFLPVSGQVSIKDGESSLNKYKINLSLLKCHASKEGENAFGSLASPTFLIMGSREEANQIFVNEYMGLRVARTT